MIWGSLICPPKSWRLSSCPWRARSSVLRAVSLFMSGISFRGIRWMPCGTTFQSPVRSRLILISHGPNSSAIIMKSLCPAGAIWSTVLQFCFIRILAGSPISTHRICAISIPRYCILLQMALRQSAGCWITSTRKQRSPKPCVSLERSIGISQQQSHGKSRMTRRASQLSCILLRRLLWMPIPFLHRSSRILRRKSMRLWADQARSLPCRILKRCLTWMIPISLIL